jgi:hypothetical protein
MQSIGFPVLSNVSQNRFFTWPADREQPEHVRSSYFDKDENKYTKSYHTLKPYFIRRAVQEGDKSGDVLSQYKHQYT